MGHELSSIDFALQAGKNFSSTVERETEYQEEHVQTAELECWGMKEICYRKEHVNVVDADYMYMWTKEVFRNNYTILSCNFYNQSNPM